MYEELAESMDEFINSPKIKGIISRCDFITDWMYEHVGAHTIIRFYGNESHPELCVQGYITNKKLIACFESGFSDPDEINIYCVDCDDAILCKVESYDGDVFDFDDHVRTVLMMIYCKPNSPATIRVGDLLRERVNVKSARKH